MKSTVGQDFLEKTKYENMGSSDQNRGVPAPPLQQSAVSDIRIDLPEAVMSPVNLGTAIENRQTYRNYDPTPLSLEELSTLLWATQGVKRIVGEQTTFRTVPSAGSRHAFETALLINRCADLEPGLYRYLALDHQISPVRLSESAAQEVRSACLNQGSIEKSAVTFIWYAVTERMIWRYADRGYRYLFLDAGHVCQNLYLAAESMGCGVCAIAAFDDNQLNEVLHLDGEHEFAIYLAALGKKPGI
ncbi:MAG: SagB/ThcOx family dehydrogenase [Anaerolineales bacterium]|nr:SagB/ThcOx family dehydrogenase [Anaerolineales bacterium]